MSKELKGASAATPAVQENKPEIKEETLETATAAIKESKGEDTVPLSKFMQEKKERQALQARVEELEQGNKPVTQDDLEDLAETYGADPKLLKELAKRFTPATKERKVEVDPETQEKLAELDTLKGELKQEKLNKIFDGLWNKANEVDPDLMALADKDTLKTLALRPENQGMTVTQLAEKIYGKFVKGKPSIESSKPGAREKTGDDVNFDKMTDEDWETVQSDPGLKGKYDEHILANLLL